MQSPARLGEGREAAFPNPLVLRAGSRRRVTVFEAAAPGHRRIFLSWTRLPMIMAMAEFRPPAALARRKPRPRSLEFRSLAFDVTPSQARLLIVRRAKEAAKEGWRCHLVLTRLAPEGGRT